MDWHMDRFVIHRLWHAKGRPWLVDKLRPLHDEVESQNLHHALVTLSRVADGSELYPAEAARRLLERMAPEWWKPIGSANAESTIARLREDNTRLKEQLADLQSQAGNVLATIAELRKRVRELGG